MFSKHTTKVITSEVEKDLAMLAKKYGINVGISAVRYGSDITMKVTFNDDVKTENGTFPDTKESRAFKDLYKASFPNKSHNIPLEALFYEFTYKNNTYRITGYNTRAHRMPVNYLMNGKSYKSSEGSITAKLKVACPDFFL